MPNRIDDGDVMRGFARLDQVPDLEVADDDPDVRGWAIIGGGGQKIGNVDELIVDPIAMKVRYLETKLNNSDRRVLIPIERATLDQQDEKVIVPLTVSDVGTLPACPPEVTRDFSRNYDVQWTTRWGEPIVTRAATVRVRRSR